MGTVARLAATLALLALVAWGVALGAWVATAAAVVLLALVRAGRGWRGAAAGAQALGIALAAGSVEVTLAARAIGARSRAGELSARDQAAVVGLDAALGVTAILAGFRYFGEETLLLAVPWSFAGPCPEERLRAYGSRLPRGAYPPRLRVWRSDYPMRSPAIRALVRDRARALPDDGPDERRLPAAGPLTWDSAAYVSADEANQVPVALNTPTTRLSGAATRVDGRWRLDLVIDAAIAYPPRATLRAGPFELEEGMFHDARAVLVPYCAEVRWSVWADDPDLARTEPDRGPLESLSTGILRAAGAGYR